MPSKNYKAVWLDEEKRQAIEDFIHSQFGLDASIGNVFSEIARFAIDFALENAEAFREFIDRRGGGRRSRRVKTD